MFIQSILNLFLRTIKDFLRNRKIGDLISNNFRPCFLILMIETPTKYINQRKRILTNLNDNYFITLSHFPLFAFTLSCLQIVLSCLIILYHLFYILRYYFIALIHLTELFKLDIKDYSLNCYKLLLYTSLQILQTDLACLLYFLYLTFFYNKYIEHKDQLSTYYDEIKYEFIYAFGKHICSPFYRSLFF